MVLITNKARDPKILDFDTQGCRITVKECWDYNQAMNVFCIYKSILEEKPDAVLFNAQINMFGNKKIAAGLGLLLPMIFKLKGLVSIVLLHHLEHNLKLDSAGLFSRNFKSKLNNFVGTKLMKSLLQANLAVVTLKQNVVKLNELYGAKNVLHIPHGSFENTNVNFEEKKSVRKKILTFGKFGNHKNIEVLIEAVELIKTRMQEDIDLVVAGTDSVNNEGYLAKVQKSYNNIPNLKFTGYILENEIQGLFSEADLIVLPYLKTLGSSGVLHLSGSHGKAVVLPDLEGFSTLVREQGYRGQFFKPNSVLSLAEAIEDVIYNEDYKLKIAKANYRAACSSPISSVTDSYIYEFKNLIQQKYHQVVA